MVLGITSKVPNDSTERYVYPQGARFKSCTDAEAHGMSVHIRSAGSFSNPLVALLITVLLSSLDAGAQQANGTSNLSCPSCRGADEAPNPGQFNFFFLVRCAMQRSQHTHL